MFFTGDIIDFDDELEENPDPDPTDAMDADAFEELAQSTNVFTDQPTVNETPEVPEGPVQQTNHTEAGNLEATSTVVIDRFPSRTAGAPIPDMPRAFSAYESREHELPGSVWAPFKSRYDWEVACWAKLHGPSSSAVTKLFDIPEVCASYQSDFKLLIDR